MVLGLGLLAVTEGSRRPWTLCLDPSPSSPAAVFPSPPDDSGSPEAAWLPEAGQGGARTNPRLWFRDTDLERPSSVEGDRARFTSWNAFLTLGSPSWGSERREGSSAQEGLRGGVSSGSVWGYTGPSTPQSPSQAAEVSAHRLGCVGRISVCQPGSQASLDPKGEASGYPTLSSGLVAP